MDSLFTRATTAGLLTLWAALAAADDTVLLAPAKPGGAKVSRTGKIVDYTGQELRLEIVGGRVEAISAERVREVRTEYSSAFLAAEKALAENRLEEAVAGFRAARQEERRIWVQRRITAELVALYAEIGQVGTAGDEFLQLVASDPDTIHFDVIPLPYKTRPLDAAGEAKARAWLRNDASPVARLLGAAWLLPSVDRAVALQTLDKLTNESDPRIAAAADWQLWRTKLVTARPQDALDRKSRFEKLPEGLRPTCAYILGETLARVNDAEGAVAAFLQPPILYPRQRALAADALLAAGRQLEKMGRIEQAAGLFGEIVARFPASEAAGEAKARLAAHSSAGSKETP